jgi:hypothetical protein
MASVRSGDRAIVYEIVDGELIDWETGVRNTVILPLFRVLPCLTAYQREN